MTFEKRLENLEDLEKKIRKLERKGMDLLMEIDAEDSYTGYCNDFAKESFQRSISWMNDCIQSKRQFAYKYFRNGESS